jgi:hypothetical protein
MRAERQRCSRPWPQSTQLGDRASLQSRGTGFQVLVDIGDGGVAHTFIFDYNGEWLVPELRARLYSRLIGLYDWTHGQIRRLVDRMTFVDEQGREIDPNFPLQALAGETIRAPYKLMGGGGDALRPWPVSLQRDFAEASYLIMVDIMDGGPVYTFIFNNSGEWLVPELRARLRRRLFGVHKHWSPQRIARLVHEMVLVDDCHRLIADNYPLYALAGETVRADHRLLGGGPLDKPAKSEITVQVQFVVLAVSQLAEKLTEAFKELREKKDVKDSLAVFMALLMCDIWVLLRASGHCVIENSVKNIQQRFVKDIRKWKGGEMKGLVNKAQKVMGQVQKIIKMNKARLLYGSVPGREEDWSTFVQHFAVWCTVEEKQAADSEQSKLYYAVRRFRLHFEEQV